MKIGDILYKYVDTKGIWIYKCIGERIYKDNTQYEMECQHCEHGYKCRILVIKVKYSNVEKYKYIETLNDCEDDKQYYWHEDNKHYFVDKMDCKKEKADELITEYNKDIENYKKRIKSKEEGIIEINAWVEG
ncbi:MAG: hypothetical protein WC343_11240 [Bacilli bacterium]|jgi:hypothetical protein